MYNSYIVIELQTPSWVSIQVGEIFLCQISVNSPTSIAHIGIKQYYFQIFDNDGDGMLSYQEFIAMMKDRVNRGLKTFSRQEGWTGFKKCVKQEVRAVH